MTDILPKLILTAGIGQCGVLLAAALVPFRLDWRRELAPLSRLHRQMYITYGGYIAMAIVAFALISLLNADALAGGSTLARCFCAYVAVFWGVRLVLQFVFDVKPHLTAWWLKLGYHALTMLFVGFTIVYGWAALTRPAG